MSETPHYQCGSGLGELAVEQLAFYFKADQQEEQGHQAIVDPKQRRLGDFQRTDLCDHRDVEKTRVKVRKR